MADLEIHALNLESSSRWQFGTREYLDEDEEVTSSTVYEQKGYFGITGLPTLYDSDRLSDATVYDVEYPEAEISPTDIDVMLSEASRYDQDQRLEAVYSFDLPTAYDLEITLDTFVDEVAHPGSRYLSMEIATDLDDPVAVDETDDEEWTSRTSTYSDASIGDEVELSSTVDSANVFALSEDVLVTDNEADEIVVEEGAAMGPTGRSGSGWFDRILSIPGAIAGSIMGLGIIRYFRGGR